MVADYEHWQELGLFKSFETYVGQTRSRQTPDMQAPCLKPGPGRKRLPHRLPLLSPSPRRPVPALAGNSWR